MYFGSLVEIATSDELFKHPLHPYTKSLLSAIPQPNPLSEKRRKRIVYNPQTDHDYSKQKPTLREILSGHWILCNDAEEAKYRQEMKDLDSGDIVLREGREVRKDSDQEIPLEVKAEAKPAAKARTKAPEAKPAKKAAPKAKKKSTK